MIETDEDFESLLHDAVRTLALYVGDETDATGIMFVSRVVHPLLLGKGGWILHAVRPLRGASWSR